MKAGLWSLTVTNVALSCSSTVPGSCRSFRNASFNHPLSFHSPFTAPTAVRCAPFLCREERGTWPCLPVVQLDCTCMSKPKQIVMEMCRSDVESEAGQCQATGVLHRSCLWPWNSEESSKMNGSTWHKYMYGWIFWKRYEQYFPGGGNIPRGSMHSSAEPFYNVEDVSEDSLCSPHKPWARTTAMPGWMHRGSPCAQEHLHGKGWVRGRKNDQLIQQNQTFLLPIETTLFFPVQKGARSTYVSSR